MTWRTLTSSETAYIEKLLSSAVPARDALRAQLQGALAQQIDDEGSLEFRVITGPKASVISRIPVEAEARDLDGMPLHMLLHVVDGVVTELEIYRDGSGPILHLPPPEEWEVFVPYPADESKSKPQ